MFAHQDYKSYRFNNAFMQYALASELGYEVAQSNAAFLLDRGEVTLFSSRHEDLVRALQYWGRSAAQGYSTAQVKLGDYHYYGLGTNVDYDTAASHYRYIHNLFCSARQLIIIIFNTFYLEWLRISNITLKLCSI